MKGLLRPLVLGLVSLALFSACPTTSHNQGIHDYVNRDLEIPLNQFTVYLGQRNVDDFSGLDVDPERDPSEQIPDFPSSPNPNTKNLDVSEQIFFGVEYSEIIRDTIGWELGLFYSQEQDTTRHTIYTGVNMAGVGVSPVTRHVETTLQMFELSLGGRYTYPRWKYFQPYAGAGLDIILADVPEPEVILDDFGREFDIIEWPSDLKLLFGGYAHTGVNFRVGSLLLGLDGRALFWADHQVNYLQAAFTIGYAF